MRAIDIVRCLYRYEIHMQTTSSRLSSINGMDLLVYGSHGRLSSLELEHTIVSLRGLCFHFRLRFALFLSAGRLSLHLLHLFFGALFLLLYILLAC